MVMLDFRVYLASVEAIWVVLRVWGIAGCLRLLVGVYFLHVGNLGGFRGSLGGYACS